MQKKIFNNNKIYRRREDPESHWACGGRLTYKLFKKTNKCCRNVMLLSDYFSKSSCIFVLKIRRFDERDEGVTETGRDTSAFDNECLFRYYKNSRLH